MEHVPFEEAQRRADFIMDIQARIMDDFAASLVGKVLPVICTDHDEDGTWIGRSCYDSPDIDGLVFFEGRGGEGQIVNVRITAVSDDGNLIGKEE